MGFGDDIMSTVAARRAREKHPQANILYGNDGKPMKRNRIHHWSEIFKNNPNITPINLIDNSRSTIWIHDYSGVRPYLDLDKASSIPGELRKGRMFYNMDFRPEIGDIYFTEEEFKFADNALAKKGISGDFIFIEPNTKETLTKNKDWGFKKWQALVDRLYKDYTFVQCNETKHNRLNNVEGVITVNFRNAAAILSKAACMITSEGGIHHAAAALNIPGVVIFGERISPLTTGYNLHSNLYIGDPNNPCGMNLPCDGCKKAMAAITVDWVEDELLKILS